MAEAEETEIESGSASFEGSVEASAFDPVALMPHDVPRGHAAYWKRLAKKASTGTGALPAVELKCIDCSGWERKEAARCQITTCALWSLNRRIFGA